MLEQRVLEAGICALNSGLSEKYLFIKYLFIIEEEGEEEAGEEEEEEEEEEEDYEVERGLTAVSFIILPTLIA